jgi:hypothetical protein
VCREHDRTVVLHSLDNIPDFASAHRIKPYIDTVSGGS